MVRLLVAVFCPQAQGIDRTCAHAQGEGMVGGFILIQVGLVRTQQTEVCEIIGDGLTGVAEVVGVFLEIGFLAFLGAEAVGTGEGVSGAMR